VSDDEDPFDSSTWEWQWEVEPAGPGVWFISITWGLISINSGYLCFGSRDRAVAKAKRIIGRRRAKEDRRRALTIRGGELS
jgi:hypothetical protein